MCAAPRAYENNKFLQRHQPRYPRQAPPQRRVRCRRFARWQRKPSGARNFAYFVTAGEAVTLPSGRVVAASLSLAELIQRARLA